LSTAVSLQKETTVPNEKVQKMVWMVRRRAKSLALAEN
jgi:hypothetical protein